MNKFFADFAGWCSRATGHALAFVLAVAACIIWAVSGPFFDYSDTWQLVINTGTTVLTFLMVFILQHSQNRDAIAIQAKLDELIKNTKHARNNLSTRSSAFWLRSIAFMASLPLWVARLSFRRNL